MNRILTTHVGSLPRSQAVTDVIFARERNEVGDAQAASKKAISKTRMPVSPACLITEANLCAGHLRCNQPRKTAVTDCTDSRNDRRPNSEVPRAAPAFAIGSI